MKKILKKFWVFIPLILAVLMYFLLPLVPDFTEYVCSRGLFKLITVPLGFITSLVPISLTELVVILALPAVIFVVVITVKKYRASKDPKRTLLSGGKIVCGALSIMLFLYMACHGVNYYRYPLEKIMEFDTSKKNADQLLTVCKTLAKGAEEARAELSVDDGGCVRFSENIYTELSRTDSGYSKLVEEYPFLWSPILRQKPVALSEAWSYTGITGMYFPMFTECNVNTAQPDFSVPFTAAHESAHSRGIAFENECNFLAFLSCINSEYPEFRYSGYMEAYKFCANALYSYDLEMWREAHECLTDGMIADFNSENKYISDHEGTVREVASSANDTFIKSQGVSDGGLSYGRVTELILAYYESVGVI